MLTLEQASSAMCRASERAECKLIWVAFCVEHSALSKLYMCADVHLVTVLRSVCFSFYSQISICRNSACGIAVCWRD
jgi:hypothetical protein